MIGDNPYVIAFVTIFIVAFLISKGLQRRDRRRCPQCQSLSMDLKDLVGKHDARFVECRRCMTALVRDAKGGLHHREAWMAKHGKSNKLGLGA